MILQEYAAKYPRRFEVLPCRVPARSPQGNFLHLLQAAPPGPVAFCDQDDIWLPEKMTTEMEVLADLEQRYPDGMPLLVFSDLRVVSEDLGPLAPSFWQQHKIAPENIHRLPRLLAQNVVTGCTAVLNNALAELARRMPPSAYMHDWWVALLVNTLGHADFVRRPLVLYRQHATNTLGAMHQPATGIPKWRQHGERRKRWEISVAMAEALLSEFGDQLRAADRRTLHGLLRSERNSHRAVRALAFLRHGFFVRGVRVNLATLWYLWDMKFAKSTEV